MTEEIWQEMTHSDTVVRGDEAEGSVCMQHAAVRSIGGQGSGPGAAGAGRQCVQGVCKGRESAPTQKTEALDRDGCGVGADRQDEVPAEEDRRHLRDTAVEEESRALSSRPAERYKTKGGRWASWSNLSTCGCCRRAKPVGSDHAASVPRGRRL